MLDNDKLENAFEIISVSLSVFCRFSLTWKFGKSGNIIEKTLMSFSSSSTREAGACRMVRVATRLRGANVKVVL